MRPVCLITLSCMLVSCVPANPAVARTRGEFEIRVVDKATGAPIAVRMHLRHPRGHYIHPRRLPFWKDHFAFQGKVILELSPGRYTFELERGPEYRLRTGDFTIKRGATDNTTITMERIADMAKAGWWSGDLHIHRPPGDIPLLMLAEDLHVAPVITWWNENNVYDNGKIPDPALVAFDHDRFYHLFAGEDERGGGALLYFNLQTALPLVDKSQREYPPMARFLELARRQDHGNVHVDIEKPFWWDMPLWIAMGMADSIGLANNHLLRDGMLTNEAWGKPRDTVLYPDPHGNGQWSQDIYYQLLNCGIRIPPSAGSASGVLKNPVGYNRVYVHCGKQLTYDGWWEGLKAGRVVVTNGPLLRPLVNGQLPGHVFTARTGETVELAAQLSLTTRDRIEYLEIVKNGKVVHEVRLSDYKDRRGQLPPVVFQKSGWMLIRAVTNNAKTFRFASTGPYYVEIGNRPRISKRSAQFFVDWTDERSANLRLDNPRQQEEVLGYWDKARAFWDDVLGHASDE